MIPFSVSLNDSFIFLNVELNDKRAHKMHILKDDDASSLNKV
jgi:hypothetical protein